MAVKAGEAFVEILADSTKLQQGLKKASARLKKFGASATRIGLQVAGIGVALAAPFVLATKTFLKVGDALDKISRRTGFAVEALSALGFAAEQSGADLATLEKGIKSMQRAINDLGRGLSTQKDAFADLGLEFKDIGKLNPENQFRLIAQRLSQISDPTKRAATSLQILGRAGAALLPLFEEGTEGIDKLVNEAKRLGLVVTGAEAKAAAEFTDEINILTRSFERLLFVVGSAVLPVMKDLRNLFLSIVQTGIIVINKNKEFVKTFFQVALVVIAAGSAIAAFGIAVTAIGIAIGAAANIIGFLTAAVAALGSVIAFLVTPFGLAIAAVVAFGVAMIVRFDLVNKAVGILMEGVKTLQDTFGAAFKAIVEAVKAGDLQGAFKILTASLNLVWVKLVAELEKAWAQFKFFIISEAANAFLGVVDIVLAVVTKIESLWNDLKFNILKIIAGIAVGAQNIFEETTGFVAKLIIDLDPTTSATTKAAIRKSIDDETKAKNEARINALAGDLTNIEAAKQAEMKAIKDVAAFRKKLFSEIAASLTQPVVEGAAGDLSKKQQEAQDDVNLASKELADAIKKTKESQENQTDKGEDTFGEVNDSFANIKSALDKARDDLISLNLDDPAGVLSPPGRRQVVAAGGFSGVEVAGEVQAVQKQSLTAQQATAKNTKDILRNQRLGGETFA